MKQYLRATLFAISLFTSPWALSTTVVKVELEVPKLDVDPYHRPYIAVWLETTERKPLVTLGVWHGDEQWLKDMRQWWRKIGRKIPEEYDAVTGATRKPGHYVIEWDGRDYEGNDIPPGEYLINLEASREEGDRSYIREKINLGKTGSVRIAAKNEFGEIVITTNSMSKKRGGVE